MCKPHTKFSQNATGFYITLYFIINSGYFVSKSDFANYSKQTDTVLCQALYI